MPNPSFKGTSWEDKRVHTFPKRICMKVNVIMQLDYYDPAVRRFNLYTTRTPLEYLAQK